MARLDVLISEFATRHQVDDLVADEDGRYALTFDDDLEVQCFERFNLVHFTSSLDNLLETDGDVSDRLRHLLNYALMRMKNCPCALGMADDDRLILFERFESDGIGTGDFEEKLERFVNSLEEFKRFLSKDRSSPASRSVPIRGAMTFRP